MVVKLRRLELSPKLLHTNWPRVTVTLILNPSNTLIGLIIVMFITVCTRVKEFAKFTLT